MNCRCCYVNLSEDSKFKIAPVSNICEVVCTSQYDRDRGENLGRDRTNERKRRSGSQGLTRVMQGDILVVLQHSAACNFSHTHIPCGVVAGGLRQAEEPVVFFLAPGIV